jgi:4-hydroxybenzoate polyprenyltransferase
LLVGSYFGVLIVAGHLVQEVQDYADDRLAGMRTNAVQFGQEPVFVLACAVFGLSFLYLIWLSQARLITGLAQFTVLLYPVFAVWAIQASRAGLAKDHVRRLRSGYRMLFALVVVVMLAGALGEKAARL